MSRPRPRPCVLPSQRRFAIFSQTSRIAAQEKSGLFMIDLPALESKDRVWTSISPSKIENKAQARGYGPARFLRAWWLVFTGMVARRSSDARLTRDFRS